MPSHIEVNENERVDTLGREALTLPQVSDLHLPCLYFKCLIKRALNNAWKLQWLATDNFKFRAISDSVRPLSYSTSPNRACEVALYCLCIGRSPVTHGFLMDNGPPPLCEDCIIPLTVHHTITECPSPFELRDQLFALGPYSLQLMFNGNYCPLNGPLHSFLLAVGLYDHLWRLAITY